MEEAGQGSTKMTHLLCFFLCLFFVHALITRASLIYDSAGIALVISEASIKHPSLRSILAVSNSTGVLTSSKERRGRPTGGGARRGLVKWPGSVPPRCRFKCGECNPCRPVHVPLPPGQPVTDEYYPEAWRCKCGNRLFMP